MECDGRIAWDKGGIRDDLGVSPMPCVLADAISGESLRRNRLVKMKEARAETLHESHMLIMESADVREGPESAGVNRGAGEPFLSSLRLTLTTPHPERQASWQGLHVAGSISPLCPSRSSLHPYHDAPCLKA